MTTIKNVDLMPTNDKGQADTFQQKVYVIADEVLSVLKELHQEHKKQIDSKLIAEKMSGKESVKKVLNDYVPEVVESDKKVAPLRMTVDKILNSLSELSPSSMIEDISNTIGYSRNKSITEGPAGSLDSAIEIVKKYVDYVSDRVYELEDLLQKTADYLTQTEKQLASELSSAQGKFQEDRDFEISISSKMSDMKQSFCISVDIEHIKAVVFTKIKNIHKSMERKKEQDILRLKETEKIITSMSRKINDIKSEADVMRERAEKAELESLCDSLTGLNNRRAYDRKIEEILANLDRYNVPSSLILCDIDHFKKINDNFGHYIGDLTLKKIAGIFKERLRKNDFIARYGGEEFACILPHLSLEGARKAGESIRRYIDRAIFSFKGKKIPVTISLGISVFKKGDDASSVFERADAALYMAKESGRNRVKTENDLSL